MSTETPDFTTWPLDRLVVQRKHLADILFISAGQDDPRKPQMRAERDAIDAEIAWRMSEGASQ